MNFLRLLAARSACTGPTSELWPRDTRTIEASATYHFHGRELPPELAIRVTPVDDVSCANQKEPGCVRRRLRLSQGHAKNTEQFRSEGAPRVHFQDSYRRSEIEKWRKILIDGNRQALKIGRSIYECPYFQVVAEERSQRLGVPRKNQQHGDCC